MLLSVSTIQQEKTITVCLISVTNFSLEWEASSTHATTKYKAGTGKDINASIGVHIGLRGVNITLKGMGPVVQN